MRQVLTRLNTPRKSIFNLTPAAKNRIRTIIAQRKAETQLGEILSFLVVDLLAPIGIRIGTKSGGCNGLMYQFNFIDEIPQGDDIVRDEDITITVEPKALLAVVGTEMDFVENEVRSEFVFKNPNATNECGCGESFSIS